MNGEDMAVTQGGGAPISRQRGGFLAGYSESFRDALTAVLAEKAGEVAFVSWPGTEFIDVQEAGPRCSGEKVVLSFELEGGGRSGRAVLILSPLDSVVLAGCLGAAGEELTQEGLDSLLEVMLAVLEQTHAKSTEILQGKIEVMPSGAEKMQVTPAWLGQSVGGEGKVFFGQFDVKGLGPEPLVVLLLLSGIAPEAKEDVPAGVASEPESSPVPQTAAQPVAASVSPVAFEELKAETSSGGQQNLDLLFDVGLNVRVELGRTTMRVKEVLDLGPGSVIELDKLAGEQVDLLVNDRLFARGEVVVIDENFGIRVTDIVNITERIQALKK